MIFLLAAIPWPSCSLVAQGGQIMEPANTQPQLFCSPLLRKQVTFSKPIYIQLVSAMRHWLAIILQLHSVTCQRGQPCFIHLEHAPMPATLAIGSSTQAGTCPTPRQAASDEPLQTHACLLTDCLLARCRFKPKPRRHIDCKITTSSPCS